MNTFVVEDETEFRSPFIESLLKFPDISVGGFADNGEEALSAILKDDYDLVFLDIKLPGLSGMEVLKKLQGAERPLPKIVLITAHTDYFEEAFDYGVSDYLVKPFTRERLQKTIDRVKNMDDRFSQPRVSSRINSFGLACKIDGVVEMVPYSDIKYLRSKGNYTDIICQTKNIRVLELIKNLESRLPDEQFIRIHRQIILNLKFLNSIQPSFHGSHLAVLKDEKQSTLNIGRKYYKRVQSTLNLKP